MTEREPVPPREKTHKTSHKGRMQETQWCKCKERNRNGGKKDYWVKSDNGNFELLDDEDVSNQKGIYEYLLDGNEKHLSIRAFSPKMARTAYERQKGICPKCGKHFEIEEMQADHITRGARAARQSRKTVKCFAQIVTAVRATYKIEKDYFNNQNSKHSFK